MNSLYPHVSPWDRSTIAAFLAYCMTTSVCSLGLRQCRLSFPLLPHVVLRVSFRLYTQIKVLRKMPVKNAKKCNRKRGNAPGLGPLRYANIAPFPRRRPITLKYCFTQNLVEAAAGAGTQQLWALNSLFDPDASSVGHQPMYYDQLFSNTGPYQRYTVTHVQLNCVFTNLNAVPVMCAFYIQPGAVDLPSRDTLLEKPMVVRKVLSGNAGGPCSAAFSRKVDVARGFGVPRAKLIDDDVYSGVWNGNPSQLLYGIFMTYGLPPAAAVTSVTLETTLVFHGYAFGLVASGSS